MRFVNAKTAGLSALLLVISLYAGAANLTGSAADHSPQARADVLPVTESINFDGTGILQRVDLRANRLMIDALAYRFDPNMKVHTLKSRFATLHALREGMEVGFTLGSNAHTSLTITEMWELPAGSVVRH